MEKKSFEERLLALSGSEELKEAKQLLKQHQLLGAWRDRAGWLCGCFRTPEERIFTRVNTAGENFAECSCAGNHSGKSGCCRHAVALIMYGGRFNPAFLRPGEEEAARYCSGLRCRSFEELLAGSRKPQAKLFIEACSNFPHVPSKWENSQLSVRLRSTGKEYLGNLNNLRLLYFEKSLTVLLKLEHFSLQEQQIIRFLAVNGEAENSMILLDAESTAEFFHCLVGFPRFYRAGRQLKIRREAAEPVLIRSGTGNKMQLTPGIRVDDALLPCGGAKVITGRGGCWIGREGEYFFLPGSCEVSWMRNFFRSFSQRPPEGAEKEFLENFPLPVISAEKCEPEGRHGQVLLDGEFASDGAFLLTVSYLYDRQLLSPKSGRLVAENGRFWRRDEEYERAFEQALALFGFQEEEQRFLLDDPERAGVFLDRALPELMVSCPGLSLSGRLAALLRGAGGLPELELKCSLLRRQEESFVVSYRLSGAGNMVHWHTAGEAVHEKRDFLTIPGGGMVRIPVPLQRFFPAAASALRNLDADGCTFEVPDCMAAYYLYLVKEIPGAMVPEIAAGPEVRSVPAAGLSGTFSGELRPYQQEGVKFLQRMTDRKLQVILADEMGLGKTVQTLAFLASRKRSKSAPALIVCPASLVTNWERETHRFVPEFKVAAPQGGSREALWKEIDRYDLVILSYAAARFSAEKLRRLHFSFLVLDEAQHIKNPGSGNAKNCKSLHAEVKIVLSGTPLENSPEDLWSIMDFLHPGMLGTLPAFRRRYGNIRESAELREDLAARIGPFILRRTKSQVAADLPPKSERVVSCELLPEQRQLYEKVRAEGLAQLKKIKTSDRRGNALVFSTLLRLRQICCHPALLPEGAGDHVPSAKSELLLELIHENMDSGHRMLLFSQFTSLLHRIIPLLEERGIPFEYLDGDTRDRQERVDRFNSSPEIPLFLLSLKAGGTGLNLTAADTVIIYDPWWNPAVELQAEDRTHRIGQEHPVTAVKLVAADTIEEKILELQQQKKLLFDEVIDSPQSGSALSIDELRFLLD